MLEAFPRMPVMASADFRLRADELIRTADGKPYRAKAGNRNRVVCPEQPSRAILRALFPPPGTPLPERDYSAPPSLARRRLII